MNTASDSAALTHSLISGGAAFAPLVYPADPVEARVLDLKTALGLSTSAVVRHFCMTEILRIRSEQLSAIRREPMSW